jgi:hypothetical protein
MTAHHEDGCHVEGCTGEHDDHDLDHNCQDVSTRVHDNHEPVRCCLSLEVDGERLWCPGVLCCRCCRV